jgi:predicted RND superfamily exporter protein
MYKIMDKVLRNRRIVFAVFIVLTIVFALITPSVKVNYNIMDYLPDDAPSTTAINVLETEYSQGVPNVRVMVPGLTVPQALEMKERLEAVEGVESVTWLDDEADTNKPLEALDQSVVENYYKDGYALFSITVSEENARSAVHEIKNLAGEGAALSGVRVDTTFASENIDADIQKIMMIAIPIILIILMLTTETWIEPVFFLVTIGVAIVINMGSNIFFGEISFITKGVAAILQLAVSMDYAIFILHRFSEHRAQGMDVMEAMKTAVAKSFKSVASSGFTTIVGFSALILLRIKFGPDVGWVMTKGIIISLICVFIFLPVMTVLFYKLIDKTKHRSFMPGMKRMGKAVIRISVVALVAFGVCVVPCYLALSHNDYVYFDIFGDQATQIGQDMQAINNEFGESSVLVLMVEKGDFAKEKIVSDKIHQLSNVTSVISYVDTVGAEIPTDYLPEDTLDQLISEHYSRMVITMNTYMESKESFETVEAIRALGDEYYPGNYYLAGESCNTYDMKSIIEEDNTRVNLIAAAAIFVILLLVFRSVSIPFILIIVIEGAIWINCGLPYFTGNSLYYIGYLVIGSLQLGATVDYAILFTSRYIESRQTLEKHQALYSTISTAAISILTSGSILFVAGFILSRISSISLLSQLGMLIGRGALLSLFAVLFVLPALLMGLDGFIQKTTYKLDFLNPERKKAYKKEVSVLHFGKTQDRTERR